MLEKSKLKAMWKNHQEGEGVPPFRGTDNFQKFQGGKD